MSQAIIIGAGIGGLSAAIALSKVGIQVDVFEKAVDLKPAGAGIVLYPNALMALRRIDMFESVADAGSFVSRGKYLSQSGKLLVDLDMNSANLGQASIGIHRARLHKVLLDKLGMDRVKLGCSVDRVVQDGQSATAIFENGDSVKADILIGADGIHSAVRQCLLGDEDLRYSGVFAWRGVAKLNSDFIQPQSGLLIFGRGVQFGATHIGDGQIYWFGAVCDRDGVGDRKSKQDVLRVFRGWTDPVEQLIEATQESDILSHNLYDREPVSSWGQGRVTLLGDAAHPMTPFMGQGGCQALEDSIALAASLKDGTDYEAALRQYESSRMERTRDFVLQSRKAQSMSMTDSSILCSLRDLVLPLVPKRILFEQFHTLSSYNLPELN